MMLNGWCGWKENVRWDIASPSFHVDFLFFFVWSSVGVTDVYFVDSFNLLRHSYVMRIIQSSCLNFWFWNDVSWWWLITFCRLRKLLKFHTCRFQIRRKWPLPNKHNQMTRIPLKFHTFCFKICRKEPLPNNHNLMKCNEWCGWKGNVRWAIASPSFHVDFLFFSFEAL